MKYRDKLHAPLIDKKNTFYSVTQSLLQSQIFNLFAPSANPLI